MHFFSSSRVTSTLVQTAMPVATTRSPELAEAEGCGWFDSSFELSHGLEITEQDDGTLYQLWSLSTH
jgi:hypothetical protein